MITQTIYEPISKGLIRLIKPRENSKGIMIQVKLDNNGFECFIPKEQLEELLK